MKKVRSFFEACFLTGFFIVTLTCCDTSSNVEDPDINYFVKYYGGDGDQYGVDMLAFNDGTFLLAGNYQVDKVTNVDTDIYLVRVNSEGDIIWEVRLGEDVQNLWDVKDLAHTNDGNVIVLADIRNGNGATSDFSLLKISPDGVLLDSALVIHSVANEYTRTVTVLDDGGYMVSGMTEFTETYPLSGHPDPDFGDIINYRFDGNLDIDPSWGPVTRGFGAHLDIAVKAVSAPPRQNDPKPFYVYGFTNSSLTGGLNPNGRLGLFYFYRQSSGTSAEVFYPGNVNPLYDTEISFVESVPATLGSGVLVVGSSIDEVGVSDIFLARLRSPLSFQSVEQDASFYRIISLDANVRAVSAASAVVNDRGFLILANEVRGTGATNFWLSKVDQEGRPLWSTTFGSEAGDDTGAAVIELPDGKIVIFGTMELADNQSKMAFVKVNRDGKLLK